MKEFFEAALMAFGFLFGVLFALISSFLVLAWLSRLGLFEMHP